MPSLLLAPIPPAGLGFPSFPFGLGLGLSITVSLPPTPIPTPGHREPCLTLSITLAP